MAGLTTLRLAPAPCGRLAVGGGAGVAVLTSGNFCLQSVDELTVRRWWPRRGGQTRRMGIAELLTLLDEPRWTATGLCLKG